MSTLRVDLCPQPLRSCRVAATFVQVGEADLLEQVIWGRGEPRLSGFNQSRRLARLPREIGKPPTGPPVTEKRRVARAGELMASRAAPEPAAELHERAVPFQRLGVVAGALVGAGQRSKRVP